jgi:serine/threonine protein kinase
MTRQDSFMTTTGDQQALRRSNRNLQPGDPQLENSRNVLSDNPLPEPIPTDECLCDQDGAPVAHAGQCRHAAPLTPPPPPAETLIGTTIDKRFRILSCLGKGGMSEVYRAEHVNLQKQLAIKVLHPREASRENSIERFQQEAKAISTLSHPNIVKVYAFGLAENGQFYLAMEFLDGANLAEILGEVGHLNWSRAVALALQIADGLEQAHSRGIVHRDLKPGNIIVPTSDSGDEIAKIVDFGIARLTGPAAKQAGQLTLAGNTCGSPSYMSPEQCRAENIDARSDIYSFGCMLYELLCGRRPFVADTALEVMKMQVEETPEFFQVSCPQIQIPQSLEAIVRKCLSKNPLLRYQTMADLQTNLKAVGSDSPTELKLQKALQKELRASSHAGSRFSALQKWGLVMAATTVLSTGAFACWHFLSQSEIARLNKEITSIPAGDPTKIARVFPIMQRLVALDRKSAGDSGENRRDHETVLMRLQELQAGVDALPMSINRCLYRGWLVRFYVALGKPAEARKTGEENLADLEAIIMAETHKANPDNRLLESALLEAARLCYYDRSKQDRMIGKYNILINRYVSQGRLPEAEHVAATAISILQNQKPRPVIAEIGVHQNLAYALMREGKFQQAESQFLENWKLCKDSWPRNCQFSKNIAASLADCYEAQGKKDEAARLRKETSR